MLRFEEERYLLTPLAERPYQSLVLAPPREIIQPKHASVPKIPVERRPLASYAALVAGAA